MQLRPGAHDDRVRQPPEISQGLSPSPLPAQRWQGAAPGHFVYLLYFKACGGGRAPAGSVPMGAGPTFSEALRSDAEGLNKSLQSSLPVMPGICTAPCRSGAGCFMLTLPQGEPVVQPTNVGQSLGSPGENAHSSAWTDRHPSCISLLYPPGIPCCLHAPSQQLNLGTAGISTEAAIEQGTGRRKGPALSAL